jgi:16S rRNA (guanine527-N7)-methyltransferase
MMLYTRDDFRRLIPVSDAVFANIAAYHDLLVKWQKAINLVSPKTIPESWHRHLLDSAQMAQYIPASAKVYADLGCGGGFPGLVVAMMRPELHVHLVESDERKGQFMRTVARETGTKNVTIHTKRVEAVTEDFTPDFVTARALASLEILLDYTYPWAMQNSALQMGFMKGKGAEDEISAAQQRYMFTAESHQSLTDPEARIVCLQGVRKR